MVRLPTATDISETSVTTAAHRPGRKRQTGAHGELTPLCSAGGFPQCYRGTGSALRIPVCLRRAGLAAMTQATAERANVVGAGRFACRCRSSKRVPADKRAAPDRSFPWAVPRRQKHFPQLLLPASAFAGTPDLSHARLSHPYLRRASQRGCRQDRPPLGLGASPARSRRAAVHRSPRPLRPDPGRGRPAFAGLQAGREAEAGMGGAHRRRGGRPHARDGQSQPADRRGRGQDQEPRSAVGSEGAAAAGVRRAGLSGGDAAADIASSISGARGCTPTS